MMGDDNATYKSGDGEWLCGACGSKLGKELFRIEWTKSEYSKAAIRIAEILRELHNKTGVIPEKVSITKLSFEQGGKEILSVQITGNIIGSTW